MQVFSNVHEREYTVPTEKLGELLDTIAGPNDRIWPKQWPPIAFDRPFAVGAVGGHGPIHYSVAAYEPGRRVEFQFDPSKGLSGTHTIEVRAGSRPGTSSLRHLLIAKPLGAMRVLVPLAILRLHNALIEDLLERAAVELGVPSSRPPRWSPYVRLLRRFAG